MKLIPTSAALFCGILLLAGTASAQFSTPVRDVENPARLATASNCVLSMGASEIESTCDVNFSAATNKTFVLNTLSIMCRSQVAAVRFGFGEISKSEPFGGSEALFVPLSAPSVAHYMEQGSVLTGLGIVVQPSSAGVAPSLHVRVLKTNNGAGFCKIHAYGFVL